MAVTVLAAVGLLPGTVTTPSACAGSEVRVAVVVDFARAAGSPGGVSSVCVGVADRSNGAAVLAARAAQLGTPDPRFDQRTGLLCGIDGFPATECPTPSSSGYWAYWLGDGSWTYAAVGPGGHRANANVVEGWRWVIGQSEDGVVAPAASSVASVICSPTPPPPTTVAPPPAPGEGPHPSPDTDTTSPSATMNPTATTTPGSTTQEGSSAAGTAPGGESSTTSTPSSSSGGAARTGDTAASPAKDATVTVADESGTGSAFGQVAGFVGGASMIALVAVGGLWFAKRRQSPGPAP